MQRQYSLPIEIGFKHCDPAGIVFYPRYVEMLNDTIESWFRHGLGVGFDELHRVRRLAIPVVQLECKFVSASRLGEVAQLCLRVQRIGRSSLSLKIDLLVSDQQRLQAELTLVLVEMDSLKPKEIPECLRASFAAYMQDDSPDPGQS